MDGSDSDEADAAATIPLQHLRGLIASGEIILLSKREVLGLLEILKVLDAGGLAALVGIIRLWRVFSVFGALGHLAVSMLFALLALAAAMATITNKWPSLERALQRLVGAGGGGSP